MNQNTVNHHCTNCDCCGQIIKSSHKSDVSQEILTEFREWLVDNQHLTCDVAIEQLKEIELKLINK